MMTLGERLKQSRLKKGWSQQRLAAASGASQQVINKLETGIVKASGYIVHLARALEVSPDWLQFGTVSPTEINTYTSQQAIHLVPMITWSQMPSWRQMDQAPSEFIPLFYPATAQFFALRIYDEAMTAMFGNVVSFREGDIIIVDPDKTAKPKDYVIAVLPNQPLALLRQFQMVENQPSLKPLNPHYPSLSITDDVQLCGVVIAQINFLA